MYKRQDPPSGNRSFHRGGSTGSGRRRGAGILGYHPAAHRTGNLDVYKRQVIEQGNHTELMKQGGFYADLYNSQFTTRDGEEIA